MSKSNVKRILRNLLENSESSVTRKYSTRLIEEILNEAEENKNEDEEKEKAEKIISTIHNMDFQSELENFFRVLFKVDEPFNYSPFNPLYLVLNTETLKTEIIPQQITPSEKYIVLFKIDDERYVRDYCWDDYEVEEGIAEMGGFLPEDEGLDLVEIAEKYDSDLIYYWKTHGYGKSSVSSRLAKWLAKHIYLHHLDSIMKNIEKQVRKIFDTDKRNIFKDKYKHVKQYQELERFWGHYPYAIISI